MSFKTPILVMPLVYALAPPGAPEGDREHRETDERLHWHFPLRRFRVLLLRELRDFDCGNIIPEVAFWHKADITIMPGDVRFRGQSGHSLAATQVMSTRLSLICACVLASRGRVNWKRREFIFADRYWYIGRFVILCTDVCG